MNTLAYIAACEVDSPNSPEFEDIHEKFRDKYMGELCTELRRRVSDALNAGAIDDEQYLVLDTALAALDPIHV